MRDDIKISRADNGFVVEYPPTSLSGVTCEVPGYVLYPDRPGWPGPNPDPMAACEMFNDLAVYLGVAGTKHDAERLRIMIVKKEGT